jgi:membrane protein
MNAVEESSTEADRGRLARHPSEIPAKGWWDILWRLVKRLGSENITLVAGGVALYALLAVFPGLAALISMYGLFASPEGVVQNIQDLAAMLPPSVRDIFTAQLHEIVRHNPQVLSLGAALGILVALWSARSAMSALITASNIAYGEREKRSFFRTVLLSLAFTVTAIFGFLLMIFLGIAIPVALNAAGTSQPVQVAIAFVRFALLWLTAALGLAVIYRYAPAREHARWNWVSWVPQSVPLCGSPPVRSSFITCRASHSTAALMARSAA